MKLLLIFIGAALIAGCASRSLTPEKDDVKMSRKAADKDCKDLGLIRGATLNAKATREEVLADLQQEAANKGANYVVIKQFSATGTAVTGQAYECP